MPYGYSGVTPNQKVKNTGVFSVNDINALVESGSWGGSLKLIQSQTVTSVSSVAFTSIQEDEYDVHFLQATNYQPSGNDHLVMRFYESGVIETASVYKHALQYGYLPHTSSGAFGENKSTGISYLKFLPDETSTSSRSGQGYCYIYNAGNSSKYTFATSQVFGSHTSTAFIGYFGGAVRPTADEITQIRFYADTDLTGTIKLFGVKQL